MAENDNGKWDLITLKFPVVRRYAQQAVLCWDGMEPSHDKEELSRWEEVLAGEADPRRRAKIEEFIGRLKGDA